MMLNFLRFQSGPVFRRVGGEIIWRGNPEDMLIGPNDEYWDLIFIARYPSAGAKASPADR